MTHSSEFVNLEREALSLATNGFDVFPVKPGTKAPPLVRYTRQATGDPTEVAGFWRQHPRANIGVRSNGGTLILDADTRGAIDFLNELGIPETTAVETPSGGRHLYLTGSAPTKAGVRPGLDVRGRGGYAVGPRSVVNGRRYEWVIPPWELAPQPAPRAVLELVKERAKFQVLDESPIPQGRRNETLTQIAGYFVGQGIRGETLRDVLHGANTRRCKPRLAEQEVEKIVNSANKWPEPPPWLTDPWGFAEDPRLDLKAHALLQTLALRARHDGTVIGGEWLAKSTRMHRNSVSAAAADLERLGRIRVHRARKRPQANVYELLQPATGDRGGSGAHEVCIWEGP
jgi:hypothetical protein